MIPLSRIMRYKSYLVPSTIFKCINITKYHTGFCPVCGKHTVFVYYTGMSLRENLICVNCLSNLRKRHVAKVLSKILGAKSLSQSAPNQQISIYNTDINDAFEKFLKKYKSYYMSCFSPNIKSGTPLGNNASWQNLECTTFDDDFFDIVITQDVLEHVRHYEDAIKEIYRILKPRGVHIFTVPINLDKPTLTRVKVDGDKDIYLTEPEYHGGPLNQNMLTYRTYGSDLITLMESIGFKVEINELDINNGKNENFKSFVFVATK